MRLKTKEKSKAVIYKPNQSPDLGPGRNKPWFCGTEKKTANSVRITKLCILQKRFVLNKLFFVKAN